MFLRQMKESPRRCVFDPPTCFFTPPSASKGRLYECKMKECLVSAPEEREKGSFRHNVSFLAAAPPALCCCITSDACLTFSRSLHAAGPLVPLPGTCGGAERARFCFLSLLSHSGVLAQGQRHLKFPAGWSHLVTVGLGPTL